MFEVIVAGTIGVQGVGLVIKAVVVEREATETEQIQIGDVVLLGPENLCIDILGEAYAISIVGLVTFGPEMKDGKGGEKQDFGLGMDLLDLLIAVVHASKQCAQFRGVVIVGFGIICLLTNVIAYLREVVAGRPEEIEIILSPSLLTL